MCIREEVANVGRGSSKREGKLFRLCGCLSFILAGARWLKEDSLSSPGGVKLAFLASERASERYISPIRFDVSRTRREQETRARSRRDRGTKVDLVLIPGSGCLLHIQKFCAECQAVVMLRPWGRPWSALSIFRRYFRRCRIRGTSGGTVARLTESQPAAAFLLLARSFTRICIISFNCCLFCFHPSRTGLTSTGVGYHQRSKTKLPETSKRGNNFETLLFQCICLGITRSKVLCTRSSIN